LNHVLQNIQYWNTTIKKEKNRKLPCLATITLETASGTLVPAAKNVIPITESGIFKVSPKKFSFLLIR